MKKKRLEYGLALGGGGTKGAYQAGVAKALKELNINITAVSGTSVGAINAAFIVQGDIDVMEELYLNIKFTDVFSDDIEIDKSKDLFDVKNIFNVMKEYIKNNGLTNVALRETLKKYLDIDKIYKSKRDLGLVTYSVKDKNVVERFKSETAKDELLDYILASSCFPIFKTQKIRNEEYVDGGLGDVIPINMLIEKGYKNIIAVDIEGIGITQSTIDKDTYVKLIYSDEDLGGMFDFDSTQIKRNMLKGYLDTMRSFNKLCGTVYYFDVKEFTDMVKSFDMKIIYGLECAAKLYGIDNYKIYKFDEFAEEILKKHDEVLRTYKSINGIVDAAKLLQKNKKISDILDNKFGICLFMDILSVRPTFMNNKILKSKFNEYLCAAEALMVLQNEYETEK